MLIDLVIPTLNREKKLKDCVNSIIVSANTIPYFIRVYIYYSDKTEFYKGLDEYIARDTYIIPKLLDFPYDAALFWNKHLQTTNANMMFYLNDDVILDKKCIIVACEQMLDNFYDMDGVIGLNQSNIPSDQSVKAAFGVIGKTFADRFPERKVFCEDYKRFYLDLELEKYATSINKFKYAKEAKLIHLHPAFTEGTTDTTHDKVRTHLQQDKKTYYQRLSKDYLWGKTYDRITSE